MGLLASFLNNEHMFPAQGGGVSVSPKSIMSLEEEFAINGGDYAFGGNWAAGGTEGYKMKKGPVGF